ncbi:MAG TPA: hypothetical protein VJQ56_00420, partial [Blastocatellia bacterium]|nr:hypothetical protein [Blastocatellia bacterium]
MPRDLSSDVEFLRLPDEPSTRAGISEEIAEHLAFNEPRRVSVLMRAANLRRAGALSGDSVSEAITDEALTNLELIVRENNILPAWFLDIGPTRSTAICKIEAAGT